MTGEAAAILAPPRDTPLLARVAALSSSALQRLDDGRAWRGYRIVDPETGGTRRRLVCVDRIEDRRHGRMWSLSLHAFGAAGETAWHDHRWPIAVLPFGPIGTASGTMLYEMPWEARAGADVTGAGVHAVRHGEPWAIEAHRRVWHRVPATRPYYSVLIADVSAPAARPDRTTSTPMSWWATRRTRQEIAVALAAALAAR